MCIDLILVETNQGQEGSEASVTLEELDPAILGRVILYQYTKRYDAGEVPNLGTLQSVQTAQIVVNKDGLSNQSAAIESTPIILHTKAGLKLTRKQAEDHLSVHVEVYSCADRLGIEELKEYACRCFVDIAGHMNMDLWVNPFYGKLLRIVYEKTVMEITEKAENKPKGPTDLGCITNGLRYAATVCAVRNPMLALTGGGIEKAMREHEPMAWGVAQVVETLRDNLKTAKRIVDNAERVTLYANQKLSRQGPEQVAYAKRVVQLLQDDLKWSKRCRGCNKDFKVGAITIEGESSLTGTVHVVLKCRFCPMSLKMQV
jgi:hypothetical protein